MLTFAGAKQKFYEWLDWVASTSLPEGSDLWVCGDCHVGNLGPVADANGRIAVQIRDFDQTVIGNPAHDLIRLELSLCMSARGSDLPGVTSAMMIEPMVDSYAKGIGAGTRRVAAAIPASVLQSMKEAERRSRRHLARERSDDVPVALPVGQRF